MKIDPANTSVNGSVQGSGLARGSERASKAGRSRGAESAGAAFGAEPAKATISPRAREMAQAKAAATEAPDVREAKIAELRRRIANQEYNVRPEDVADRLVKDHIETADLG